MQIIKAKTSDARTLAVEHQRVFPGFFLSTLGTSFLTTYYKALLKHPETICYLAVEDQKVLGYVVGRTRAHAFLKRVIKRNPLPFFLQGIKLLFTHTRALIRLANNLEKKNTGKGAIDEQEYGEIALIGVSPEMKGRGIGHKLMRSLEADLKDRGVTQLSLTTDYYDNDDTLRAYKAWGFTVLYEFTTYPNRRMYRLIKNVE